MKKGLSDLLLRSLFYDLCPGHFIQLFTRPATGMANDAAIPSDVGEALL